jgi:hypothetical protein
MYQLNPCISVFAAFGDTIVMWDARTGVDRGQSRLPSLRDEFFKLGQVVNETDVPFWFNVKPCIQSLLLYENRLVVFVDGYGDVLRWSLDDNPLLLSYLGTRVLVYDTSALAVGGSLIFINQKDINGYLSKARRIGSNIHVVTMSTIDTFRLFEGPLSRQSVGAVTDATYIASVRRMAETLSIPAFVTGLTNEIIVNGTLPNILRMSIVQTECGNNPAASLVYQDGLHKFYVQVSSLDLNTLAAEPSTEPGALVMNITGAFLPYFGAHVYSAVDTLIFSIQGIDFVSRSLDYYEFTYLMAWDLNGPSAEVRAVGRVPGALLNDYALDVVDNIVRIGTTVKTQRWCCDPLIPNVTATNNSASTTSADVDWSTTSDLNATLPAPTSNSSETFKYISMLRIPVFDGLSSSGTMEVVGQLELGNSNEEFTSVRFSTILHTPSHFQRLILFTFWICLTIQIRESWAHLI